MEWSRLGRGSVGLPPSQRDSLLLLHPRRRRAAALRRRHRRRRRRKPNGRSREEGGERELLERVTAKRVGFVRLLSSPPLPLNYCSLLCSSHRLPRPGSPLLLLLHRRLRRRSPFVRLSLSLGRTDSLPPPPPLLPPPKKSYYTPLPAPLTELTYPLHYSSLL